MQLAIKSNAFYLSVSKASSQAARYFYLTSNPGLHNLKLYNGPIHIDCCVMKDVLSSATKAELGALFHNSEEACPLQTTLDKMGRPQNATTISTNNSTTAGISNSTVKQ
jgi:hypothetical protein